MAGKNSKFYATCFKADGASSVSWHKFSSDLSKKHCPVSVEQQRINRKDERNFWLGRLQIRMAGMNDTHNRLYSC